MAKKQKKMAKYAQAGEVTEKINAALQEYLDRVVDASGIGRLLCALPVFVNHEMFGADGFIWTSAGKYEFPKSFLPRILGQLDDLPIHFNDEDMVAAKAYNDKAVTTYTEIFWLYVLTAYANCDVTEAITVMANIPVGTPIKHREDFVYEKGKVTGTGTVRQMFLNLLMLTVPPAPKIVRPNYGPRAS